MRTWRYHKNFPEGRIFDTEGVSEPVPPPASSGWLEHRGDLALSTEQLADKMVENAVKTELKQQGPHREELERGHVEKYGRRPDARATNEEVANVMDNRTPDGTQKIHKSFTKRT